MIGLLFLREVETNQYNLFMKRDSMVQFQCFRVHEIDAGKSG